MKRIDFVYLIKIFEIKANYIAWNWKIFFTAFHKRE